MQSLQELKAWLQSYRLEAEAGAAKHDHLENHKAYNWYLGQMLAIDCCISKIESLSPIKKNADESE